MHESLIETKKGKKFFWRLQNFEVPTFGCGCLLTAQRDTYDMSRHQKAVLINRGAQNQKHYMYVLKITKKATGRVLIM